MPHFRRIVRCPFSTSSNGLSRAGGVSIVIPTFRRPEALARLIESIKGIHYPNVETVVVNCAPEPVEPPSAAHECAGVKVIQPGAELLPASARNLGARAASGNFLFFIDDDNVVDREAVCWLVSSISFNSRLGLAAPIVYYMRSEERVWSAGVRRGRISSLTRFPGQGTQPPAFDVLREAHLEDFPDAYMVPRSVFMEIGGYDELRFPIHYEESDLCRRIKDAGYALRLVPDAAVWHDLPVPGSSPAMARQHHVHTPLRAFYAGRNRVLFSFRHERGAFPAFLFLFLAPVTLYYVVIIASDAESSKAAVRAYLGGVYEGVRYARRRRVEA